MTYKSDDERELLKAFLVWLLRQGWINVQDSQDAYKALDEFMKKREIH